MQYDKIPFWYTRDSLFHDISNLIKYQIIRTNNKSMLQFLNIRCIRRISNRFESNISIQVVENNYRWNSVSIKFIKLKVIRFAPANFEQSLNVSTLLIFLRHYDNTLICNRPFYVANTRGTLRASRAMQFLCPLKKQLSWRSSSNVDFYLIRVKENVRLHNSCILYRFLDGI